MLEIKREVRLLVLLLVILFVAYVWYIIAGAPRESMQPAAQQAGAQKTPPPLTAEVVAQLQQSHGFQMFVSYTDRGFEPMSATIKAGDTVRFTNNSSRALWIASAPTGSSGIYPGMSDCGGTALDTCKALKPGDFWEFTFTQSGTWWYQNNLNKNDTAIVRVK
jgi:plastocyanin